MYDTLKLRLRQHEGAIPYMYLDTLGLVTCAVGHLLSTVLAAQTLPFVTATGQLATPLEIAAEYHLVAALKPAMLPAYYEAHTTLRLPDAAIAAVLDADVSAFAVNLQAYLPQFPQYPEPAGEALLDMTFQLGAAGLMHEFPTLIAAVSKTPPDWLMCAANCHRIGIQEWRNQDTAALFRSAAAPA